MKYVVCPQCHRKIPYETLGSNKPRKPDPSFYQIVGGDIGPLVCNIKMPSGKRCKGQPNIGGDF